MSAVLQDKMKGMAIECEPVPNVATPRLKELIVAALDMQGSIGQSSEASSQVCSTACIYCVR